MADVNTTPEYWYAAAGGYSGPTRPTWRGWPDTRTPITEQTAARWDTAIDDLKSVVFNVKDYMATGDGSTDDASAIQRAINDCAVSGGVVFFPPGTYIVGTVLTLYSKVRVVGSGARSTLLKLKSAANTNVFTTTNFATLTGTSKPAPGETDQSEAACGPSHFSIENLTVDGNKANNSSGYGLRLYGYEYLLSNMRVRNCAEDGIYSEWGTDASVPDSGNADSMEANIVNVKIHHCGGNGVTWKGPHDSYFDRVSSYLNTGHGFYNTGNDGGTQYGMCHAYANSKHGWLIERGVHMSNCQAESHNAGWYQIDVQANGCTIVGARVFASGATGGSAESGIRIGTAISNLVTGNLIGGTFSLLNGHWVNFAGDAGANVVRAVGPIGTGVPSTGTANSGTVYEFITGDSAQDTTHARTIRAGTGATGTILLDNSGRILIAASSGGHLELAEQSSGPSGTADRAKLFARDNGAGKTQLCVQFGTGVVQVLATEP